MFKDHAIQAISAQCIAEVATHCRLGWDSFYFYSHVEDLVLLCLDKIINSLFERLLHPYTQAHAEIIYAIASVLAVRVLIIGYLRFRLPLDSASISFPEY